MGPIIPNVGIAVDATNVYWSSGPPAGVLGGEEGSPRRRDADAHPWGRRWLDDVTPGPIAIDDVNVYCADGSGTVFRVPLAGGRVTTLATGQTNPDAIAVDATSVYWIDNGSTVMKLSPK